MVVILKFCAGQHILCTYFLIQVREHMKKTRVLMSLNLADHFVGQLKTFIQYDKEHKTGAGATGW